MCCVCYTHKGPETSKAVTVIETASAIMYTCVGMLTAKSIVAANRKTLRVSVVPL